ncbi:hypothetical protein CITSP_04090 [Citrobacter sp. T1.2D-1]|nr:hypothetical protein CITSP_04090 [Citrobacter sp. T1.2D-1]
MEETITRPDKAIRRHPASGVLPDDAALIWPGNYMTAAKAFATRCTFATFRPATHMRPLAIR